MKNNYDEHLLVYILLNYFRMENKTLFSNIPKSIEEKIGKNLHQFPNHPIEIVKKHIISFFQTHPKYQFDVFENFSPVVTIEDNFDKLLIPKDHPARSKADTYYVNENEVLRTHTSAHQNILLAKGCTSFIVIGDVYRKDEIDSHHYPVFHQMELLTFVDDDADPVIELKNLLSEFIQYLFPTCEYRFNSDYFPFTDPSFEVEVKYFDKWMEILGCGVVQPKILENNGFVGKKAIAAGFGIDRLVMIFFEIPDIRYLWSKHERFLSQFNNGQIQKFKSYSEIPSQKKDISFYLSPSRMENSKWLDENEFFELVREHSNDLMEQVKIMDSFYNEKLAKHSRTYTLIYSLNDPSIRDPGEFTKLVNSIQDGLRIIIQDKLNVVLR